MRDVETNFAWARRLTERRARRHSDERIVRWIAPPVALKKNRMGQRSGVLAPEGSSNDNRAVVASRAAS